MARGCQPDSMEPASTGAPQTPSSMEWTECLAGLLLTGAAAGLLHTGGGAAPGLGSASNAAPPAPIVLRLWGLVLPALCTLVVVLLATRSAWRLATRRRGAVGPAAASARPAAAVRAGEALAAKVAAAAAAHAPESHLTYRSGMQHITLLAHLGGVEAPALRSHVRGLLGAALQAAHERPPRILSCAVIPGGAPNTVHVVAQLAVGRGCDLLRCSDGLRAALGPRLPGGAQLHGWSIAPTARQAEAVHGLVCDPVALVAAGGDAHLRALLPQSAVAELAFWRRGLRVTACDGAQAAPLADYVVRPDEPGWPAGGLVPLHLFDGADLQHAPLLTVHLASAAAPGLSGADEQLAVVPVLLLPQAAADEMGRLWRAMLQDRMSQQPELTPLQAAGASYPQFMGLVLDYCLLLKGCGGAPASLVQGVTRFLAQHSMHASLQLLVSARLAESSSDEGDDGDAGASCCSPASCSAPERDSCWGSERPEPTQPPYELSAQAWRGAALGFAAPGREAAYARWKAHQLLPLDAVISAGQAAVSIVPGWAMHAYAGRSADPRAHQLVWGAALHATALLAPALLCLAARRTYLRHRGWVWAACQAAAGLLTLAAVTQLASPQLWISAGGAMFKRPLAAAVTLHLLLPLLQRLTLREQLLAAAGQGLITCINSRLAGGPALPAATPLLMATSLLLTCAMDAHMRRRWLQAQAARSAKQAADAAKRSAQRAPARSGAVWPVLSPAACTAVLVAEAAFVVGCWALGG